MVEDLKRTVTDELDRRDFFRAGTGAGLAALAASGACRSGESVISERAAGTDAFELEEVSIAELGQGMESGRWSSQTITQGYLDRIEALDGDGPSLRSIIEVNPDALALARELDRERSQSGSRGPLHGVPIVLKDNIDTADKMKTAAGSLALESSIPLQDSFVASKLRSAGAVLLAKANLSEWANFRSDRSSSGWSGRGGQCKNPYVLNRNPCGSSSGSAVAVSASLAAGAIGTETDGSIVCPSTINGVVGIKPTLGLVSRSGIIPIAHSQDTAGPIARTVQDAVIILSALAGLDSKDPMTIESETRSSLDYTEYLDPEGLRGSRIGVARQFFGFNPDLDRILESSLDEIRAAGGEVVDPVQLPDRDQYSGAEFDVLLYEFKAGLNRYLEGLGSDVPVRSLSDVIRFNRENAELEMPYFGQDILLMAEEMGPLSERRYQDALTQSKLITQRHGIDKAINDHQLDAILAPTGGPAWVTDWVNGDRSSGGSSGLAAVAGYPNLTVPAGAVHGLPVGVSFFGPAWSEPTLIRLAYAFEQRTQARTRPRFLEALA